MIQIRNKDGSILPVSEGQFVELINDTDQTVGSVFFQSGRGVMHQIVPGSRDAARYEQLFGAQKVKFTGNLIRRTE